MLINRVEFPALGHRPLFDAISACATHLEIWRKLFSRRCTRHSEMLDVLDTLENASETVGSNSAVSDPGTTIITKLLPNLRCSA